MRSTGSASPALAPVRFHRLELRRSVDPPDLPRIRRRPGSHVPARGAQDGDGVGQIELPLPVLVAHLGQRLAEARVAETIDRGIDLADPPFLLGGILVLIATAKLLNLIRTKPRAATDMPLLAATLKNAHETRRIPMSSKSPRA